VPETKTTAAKTRRKPASKATPAKRKTKATTAKRATKAATAKAAPRKPAAARPAAAGTSGSAPRKKGVIHAVRSRVGKKKAKASGGFGGYRKRTMTAREFAGSLRSLAPQASMIYEIWGKQDLDPGFREELMLAVAKLNDCRYCTWGHHEWAYMSGVSEEELAQLENMDSEGFDRVKWVAISYVRALVSAGFGEVSPELLDEMNEHYSPKEIKEIELVAQVMDIANRGANTWDAMLSRIRGNPANDSHLVDELVMSGVFWSAAPVVVMMLAREAKRPFREMWRDMVDFVTHYDDPQKDAAA